MSGIFITPLCDDFQLRPTAPLFAVCATDHTLSKPLEWTNIERSLWQHAITIIAWEKQLFSAQLRADVKQYYQSDKAMYM